ncbi:MAG: glycosyltransferase family 2 protein, partial [Saprospiraceae bacterium]|nr:glycosyltransferase family 2 protein [Saprospiraceae bacterium]
MRSTDLHIALPAFNEAKVLRSVLTDLRSHGFENIIVVNDGSGDKTGQLAEEMGADVITHIRNRGAGAASQTSISFAREKGINYLLLMDADGQHHSEDAHNLYQEILKGEYDIIIGNRFILEKNEIPRIRIFFNSLANRLTNLFCKNNYSDSQSGFRILNRKAIETLDLKVDGYGFCSEMIIVGEKSGLRIGEVPIKVEYTEYSLGKGQSFANGVNT